MSEELTQIGPYEIVERVPYRGRGRLYKATDPEKGTEVTIRMMPPELSTDKEHLERFEREIEVASKVSHPNVARILDHGQQDGRLYYVTEWVEGPTLRRTLRKRRLSLQEVFPIFKQIAHGIGALHAQGIIHRELNPGNIMVSEDLSTVTLSNFGISRSAPSGGGTLTSTASSTGGFHYMSPEAAVDDAGADERSDIYSLGAVFYQMLTGKLPSGQFGLPSRADGDVPDSLDPVVLKCLEANPANRYSSVASLLREVERLEDQLGLRLVSELEGIGRSFSMPAAGIFRHRGGMLAVGIVVVAGIIGFGLWSARARSGDPAGPQGAAVVEPSPLPSTLETVPAAEDTAGDAVGEGVADVASSEESQAEPTEVAVKPVEAPKAATPARGSSRSGSNSASRLARALEIATDKARNGLVDQALADLEKLVGNDVDSAIASEALFLRARIEQAQKRFDEALGTYTEIRGRFADAGIQARARYRFGRAAIESGDARRRSVAQRALEEVAREHPESEYAPRALAALAVIQAVAKSRTEDAVLGRRVATAFVTSRTLIERYPDDPAAEPAYWLMGEEYDGLKLFDRAVDAFYQLATRFPETELDAWWRCGQLYDRRLDDKVRALDAYRRVPEGSRRYGDAQKRINRLSR